MVSTIEDDQESHTPGPAGLPCPSCHELVGLEHENFVAYFATGATPCPWCNGQLDWWKEARGDFARQFPEWQVATLVGATVTVVKVDLLPEQMVEIHLAEHDVPPNAEILNVFVDLLPGGPPPCTHSALLVDPPQLRLDPFPAVLRFYGAAHGQGTLPTTQVVTIAWIAPDAADVSVHHLADAARQFAAERYRAMIIPANVAVEAALSPAMHEWVRCYSSKEDTDDFIGPRGATYSQQLKVLSKIASRALGIREMPNRIRNLLDELRQYRNDLVHRGTFHHKDRPAPNKEKAAEFLAAAAFGYHYARYLREELGKSSLVSAKT